MSRVVCLLGWPTFFVAVGMLLVRFPSSMIFPVIAKSLKFFFSCFFSVGSFVLFFMWCPFSVVVVFGCCGLTFGSVCVDGKTFEFSGGGGGSFSFRVKEFNRRRRFLVTLSLEEFSWLVVEWVRFRSSKGDSLWVKTFRWNKKCWLLQLRTNLNGRFIMLSIYANSG